VVLRAAHSARPQALAYPLAVLLLAVLLLAVLLLAVLLLAVLLNENRRQILRTGQDEDVGLGSVIVLG
jgi:hypothetical protein